MKKLVFIITVLAGIAGVYFAMKKMPIVSLSNGNKCIAIFIPTTHTALEEIEQGFKEILQGGSEHYVFTTFNANGNKTLLRAQAEEIIQARYDLIFTIGAETTHTIAGLLSKKGVPTSHVFGGVDGQDFAVSVKLLNPLSTGVYVKVDYKKEMDILHAFKPNIKNILLVYDPTQGTGLERYKLEIGEYIKKYGMTLHSVEIYQTNEIQQKVTALLPMMDVVLVLIDNTVVAGIDALITLCNRYNITLLASDLASGQKGAALAYGITEYELGNSAGQQALKILEHGIHPDQIPVKAVDYFRVEINKNTAQLQNVDIDDKLIIKYGAHHD